MRTHTYIHICVRVCVYAYKIKYITVIIKKIVHVLPKFILHITNCIIFFGNAALLYIICIVNLPQSHANLVVI